MAKKAQSKINKLSKKVAREQVAKSMETSLGDLQAALGKKKFRKRMKKVVKILSAGLPEAPKLKKLKVKNIILPGQDQKSMLSKDSNGTIEPNLIGKR